MNPFKKAADDKKVEFFMETTATKLLTGSKGAVAGVLAKGKDTQSGKSLKGFKPEKKPAFDALKVETATLGTMSGLKIDLDTHVLSTKGGIIPGLFAAGEVANGDFFNQEYPASGTSIQMSLTFGRGGFLRLYRIDVAILHRQVHDKCMELTWQ